MSKFDENLFVRISVLGNYVSREQLEECLEIQRAQETPEPIGKILLDHGFLKEEQFQRILEVRRQKIRRLARRQHDARAADLEFATLALRSGGFTPGELEDAVLEQGQMRSRNLHFTLGEVLASRNGDALEGVFGILERQDRRMLRCAVCDSHYRVVSFDAEKAYECVRCGGELEPPAYLDSLLVDGVIDTTEELADQL